jgi:hypothetical protein
MMHIDYRKPTGALAVDRDADADADAAAPILMRGSMLRRVARALGTTAVSAALAACGGHSVPEAPAEAAAAPTTPAVAVQPADTLTQASQTSSQGGQTGATSAPSAGTVASQKLSLNSVDTVVADMTQASSLSPPQYANSFATMNSPTPTVTPYYRLMGVSMDALVPWLVIGRDGSDQSWNTRVEARNEKGFVLYSDGSWVQVVSGRPSGRQRLNGPFLDSGAGDEYPVDANTTSVSVPLGYLQEMWSSVALIPDWWNVIGFFATAEVRLVVANDAYPDDRASARWSAQIGCDWLNYAAFRAQSGALSNAAGSGRFKQITNDWQPVSVISMKGWMTSTKGPPEDPGYQVENPYQWPRDWNHPLGAALTEDYVRSNPPPL